MSRTVDDYLGLITSAFKQQPNFTAMVSFGVAVQVQVQSLMSSMSNLLFDLDVAVGDQLDIIGKWVGVSRVISIPISGVYFSWDGAVDLGWDFGVWQPNLQPSSTVVLPDDVYRTLIKAKIAANHWDGTIEGAYAVWEILFPALIILIQDNQDMSYDLIFFGGPIDSLTVALITGGYIPLKPEGVRVNSYFFPVDTGPIFGWDLDSSYITGWDDGSWAIEKSPT